MIRNVLQLNDSLKVWRRLSAYGTLTKWERIGKGTHLWPLVACKPFSFARTREARLRYGWLWAMSTKALIDRRILDVCACNNPLFESSFTCNRTLKCGNKRQFNYFPQPLLLGRLLSRSVLLPERLEQAILALCMSTPICMRTALVSDSLHMVSICINVFG